MKISKTILFGNSPRNAIGTKIDVSINWLISVDPLFLIHKCLSAGSFDFIFWNKYTYIFWEG